MYVYQSAQKSATSGCWDVALLASVCSQLPYLAVHLVKGIADLGLQPRPAVVGEVSGQFPRFLED